MMQILLDCYLQCTGQCRQTAYIKTACRQPMKTSANADNVEHTNQSASIKVSWFAESLAELCHLPSQ